MLDVEQQRNHCCLNRNVEGRYRLVGNDQRWIGGERTRDGDALFLATGQLGWLAVGLGLALFVWTLWTFARHRTTVNPYGGASALCMGGPFRYSRNPIYLGDWFILAGVSLLLGTVWPLVFAPLIWITIRFGVIRHEEAHLEAKFGDAYRDYTTRVRRWI